MGDIMYTVDKIIDDIIVLIDCNNNIYEEKKELFPNEIKENDVVIYKEGKYLIDKEETIKLKNSTRDLFNSLIN